MIRIEKEKYQLLKKQDKEILQKCEILADKQLSKEDELLVNLILTQLLDDWRAPLLDVLNNLLDKYK